MPVSRMRMRPWLEQMIESDSVSGLRWVDKDKTTFCIPWKHAARHGWEMDKDASLFKKWAMHTGKYAVGQSADPKTWKANFRCAMNSLPDIEEVKDKSVNKGHQAVRVYRLLPVPTKSKGSRRKSKDRKSSQKNIKSEDTDDSDAQSPLGMDDRSPEDTSSTQENTVDSTDNRAFMPAVEIPDWSNSVEIGSTNDLCRRFEVSPEHTIDYECDDIIEICQQMEKEGWLANSFDGTGSLINETCKESCSPGSSWSESSSVDEVEDLPHYTVLGSNFSIDDAWGWPQQIPHLFLL